MGDYILGKGICMALDLKKLFPNSKFPTAEELKAKEDTFSVGDRVKVADNIRCRQKGRIGTIVQIEPEDKHGWKSFIVKFDDEKYNPMGFNSGSIDKIDERENTMKKIDENQKITLTIGQLKRLVKESSEDGIPEEPAEDFGKYIDFGCKVLMFGVEAHLWHLNCESNAAHLALKDLYEGCNDSGDKLLEATLGITGGYIENKSTNSEYDFGNLRYNSESAVAKIRELVYKAQDLIDECNDSGIENILADFCEMCNSVIYKLKRLK